MQSFAKAAASKKDSKPKLAPPPAQSSEKKTSSTAMASDDDDGEEDSPSDFLPKPKAPGDSAAARKARDDRVAELKRMMEEDDEDEAEEAPSSPDEVPQETPQDAEEAEMKLEADAQSQGQGDSQGGEVVSGSGNGRKRGKRKVIKKRQVQDDEGYFGKSLQLCLLHGRIYTVANHPRPASRQSRFGKQLGSPSLRMRPRCRRRPPLRRLLAREVLQRRRNRHPRDKEVSCHSLVRRRDGVWECRRTAGVERKSDCKMRGKTVAGLWHQLMLPTHTTYV